MNRRFIALALLLIVVCAPSALADSFFGKITLVQTTSNGTRFFIQPKGLSLFASAEHRALLLEAFMRKAPVSVGYQPIACTGGITGTCGTVTTVTVDAVNIP